MAKAKKAPNPKITAEMLRKLKACEEMVKIFEREWPDGAEVTRGNAARAAVALGLDISWAAINLLTAPACKVYCEAVATAWKVYQEAEAAARKVYQEAVAAAFVLAWDGGRGCRAGIPVSGTGNDAADLLELACRVVEASKENPNAE